MPLAIAPGIFLEHEVVPKLIVLFVCTAMLLCTPWTWWDGAVGLMRSTAGRWFGFVLAAQVLSVTISTLLSRQPGLAFGGSSWHRLGLVTHLALAAFGFVCAASIMRTRAVLHAAVAGTVFAAGAAALYAIAQYFGWDPLLTRSWYTSDYGGEVVRVPSTLGHAIYLGAFLSAATPLCFGVMFRAKGPQRYMYGGTAISLLTALLLSGSRSALLGLAAAAAVLAASLRLRVSRRAVVAAAAAAILLACGAAIFLQSEPSASLRLRLAQWRDDAWGGPRLAVWRDTVSLIALRPFAGFGPDTFPGEFRSHQTMELWKRYPDHTHESPHNAVLEAGYAQGLPGIFVMAGLLGVAFSGGRGGAEVQWLRAATTAAFVSMFFTPSSIAGLMMLYFAVAAIAAMQSGAARGAANPPRAAAGATVLAGLALLLAALFYARQDRRYVALGAAIRGGSVEQAAGIYQDVAGSPFPSAGDDLWCSRQFAMLARALPPPASEHAWRMAARASARSEATGDNFADAAYQSAVVAFSLNDGVTGERKLQEAIAAAPGWYKPRLLLGQFLQVSGRAEESRAAISHALDLAGPLRHELEKSMQAAAAP